jgi:hypothetical protein
MDSMNSAAQGATDDSIREWFPATFVTSQGSDLVG